MSRKLRTSTHHLFLKDCVAGLQVVNFDLYLPKVCVMATTAVVDQ